MKKIRILLVEDDLNLGTLTKEFLQLKGFDVAHCLNGEAGLNTFKENDFDFCILDIMMPKLDGFSLAKEISAFNSRMPFLFLSAKTMLNDKIEGLKIGADDYITKPFSMEELLLRINAILKRTGSTSSIQLNGAVRLGRYSFDYQKRILSLGSSERKLTSKESELLRLLCARENQLLPRAEALMQVWQDDNYFTSRSMDVYITKLRNYLKEDENVQIINVHGSGFKLFCKK